MDHEHIPDWQSAYHLEGEIVVPCAYTPRKDELSCWWYTHIEVPEHLTWSEHLP